MYAKCGSVEDAYSIFTQMKSKDVISWSAMISAYGQHGYEQKALDLFYQMEEENAKLRKRIEILEIEVSVLKSLVCLQEEMLKYPKALLAIQSETYAKVA